MSVMWNVGLVVSVIGLLFLDLFVSSKLNKIILFIVKIFLIYLLLISFRNSNLTPLCDQNFTRKIINSIEHDRCPIETKTTIEGIKPSSENVKEHFNDNILATCGPAKLDQACYNSFYSCTNENVNKFLENQFNPYDDKKMPYLTGYKNKVCCQDGTYDSSLRTCSV